MDAPRRVRFEVEMVRSHGSWSEPCLAGTTVSVSEMQSLLRDGWTITQIFGRSRALDGHEVYDDHGVAVRVT